MRWFLLLAILAGCATPEPQWTPAELDVPNGDLACLKSVFVGGLAKRGYQLTQSNDFEIVAEKETQDSLASMLASSRGMSVLPTERVSVTFASISNQVRAVFNSAYVTNRGTAFEQTQPVEFPMSWKTWAEETASNCKPAQ